MLLFILLLLGYTSIHETTWHDSAKHFPWKISYVFYFRSRYRARFSQKMFAHLNNRNEQTV